MTAISSWRNGIALLALLAGLSSGAEVPFLGRATDPQGLPKADGSWPATFTLYDSATGGSALWSESQTITSMNGLFAVVLGAKTEIPDTLLSRPHYLGVAVEGSVEASPRQRLAPVPFARRARSADSTGAVAELQGRLDSLRTQLAAARDSVPLLLLRATLLEQLLSNSPAGYTAGIAWNVLVPYGAFIDSRDGQRYRTVTIQAQTWMAQNLNYAGSGTTVGTCYAGVVDSCARYGRLYSWSEVMDGNASSAADPSGIRGLCPSGWHVPSDSEWQDLEIALGMNWVAARVGIGMRGSGQGTLLKSSSGWLDNSGTDLYGFRALPGGFATSNSGKWGYWWSATESSSDTTKAWKRSLFMDYAEIDRSVLGKSYRLSLRCVQN